MTKSAEDVEREVEESRLELDRTVDALKERMTPNQLFDDASRAVGGAGRDMLSSLVNQAKENPMPVAMIGLGLAWLMASSAKSHRPHDGTYGSSPYEPRSFGPDGGAHRLGDTAHRLGEKVSDGVHAAGSRASDVLSTAQGRVQDAAASATQAGRSAARQVGMRADDYRHQAQRTFQDAMDRDPILIGGLALVVGAAIGAALPATAAEDSWVGETRDKLLDKGKDAVEDGFQKAQGVAQSAYGAVKSELQASDGGGDLAQRVADAARAGVHAAKEETQGGAMQ